MRSRGTRSLIAEMRQAESSFSAESNLVSTQPSRTHIGWPSRRPAATNGCTESLGNFPFAANEKQHRFQRSISVLAALIQLLLTHHPWPTGWPVRNVGCARAMQQCRRARAIPRRDAHAAPLTNAG